MNFYNEVDIATLQGLTFTSVVREYGGYHGDEGITFTADNGKVFRMEYHQDCCAGCDIEDIIGDLGDLVDTPMIEAREDSNKDNPKSNDGDWEDESCTWTFYNFRTIKGSVTIRWYGSSNGYYSERAGIYEGEA